MLPAWVGGAVAAVAASSLTLLLHGQPLGSWLWQSLPVPPAQPVPLPLAWAAALLPGLGAAWIGSALPRLRRIFGLLATASLLTLSQSIVLALHHIAWEPLPTLLAIVGAGTIAALLRPELTGPTAWFIDKVSPPLLARLAQAENQDLLRPAQRDATILTCRLLPDQTPPIEPATPRDVLKFHEAFRAQASRILLDHGACLDPTEASGVRAFFGLPLPLPSAADDAVAAALALREALAPFAPSSEASPPNFGIGLATGPLTAGFVDHTYSALGEAAELSRWLAAETAHYEVPILLDAPTHFAASHLEDRPLEFVNPPVGPAVEIFQLLGTIGSLSPEALARRQAFRDAITLLRAGHAEDARRRFADASLGLNSPDPVLEHFISLANDQSQRDAASSAPLAPPGSAPSASPRRKPAAARKLPRRS